MASILCAGGATELAAAKASKTTTASVPLPAENDVTIARVKITPRSHARLKGTPKIKLKGAKQLPAGVTVLASMARVSKRNSAEGYVVIVKPQGSISVAPASLRPLDEQDARVSITGRVPLRARTTTAADVVSNDRSSSPACGGIEKTGSSFRGLASTGDVGGILSLARRRCRNEPPFSVILSFESWTHHKPTQDETLVCALVATDPAQANAENHAFLGQETGLGVPTIANGPGTLNAQGMQQVSFAVQQSGIYRISIWVRGAGGITQSGKTTIVVPPPEVNGPSEC